MRKIRVLVVDDSLIFREVIARGLGSDPEIEVVARAVDPFDARDKILAFRPDVMTCDIEMPKMNGIEFIRRLIPQYPLPVVVVSTISGAVFDALNAGAVDFATKPDVQSAKNVEIFLNELIDKIKIAAGAKVQNPPQQGPEKVTGQEGRLFNNKVIAIGASTGGTEAIYHIIKRLSPTVPGIVVAQHIPPVFSKMFAERLNDMTQFKAKEAQTGDFVEPGSVLVAPGGEQMRLKKQADRYKVECFKGEKVNGHAPSVDVLFTSVAQEAGKNSLGVILTGMGYDGAKGLLAMRRKGARTLGQDMNSSVVYGMPKVAFELGAVEKQASLDNIPDVIFKLLARGD